MKYPNVTYKHFDKKNKLSEKKTAKKLIAAGLRAITTNDGQKSANAKFLSP